MNNRFVLTLCFIVCLFTACSAQPAKETEGLQVEHNIEQRVEVPQKEPSYDSDPTDKPVTDVLTIETQTETVAESKIEAEHVSTSTGEENSEEASALLLENTTEADPLPLVCVEAGHQRKGNFDKEPIAPDSSEKKNKVAAGTTGVATKKPEYELNLEVALKLETALAEHFEVLMVRSTNDVDISNSERSQMCNDAGADVMLRIHADGSENKNTSGFSILYPSKDSKYTVAIAEESKAIAAAVEEQMMATMGDKSRGLIPRSDLAGFNWSEVPSVLVEMGFMTNKEEDLLMSTPEYQDQIVAGIAEGLYQYYYLIKPSTVQQ